MPAPTASPIQLLLLAAVAFTLHWALTGIGRRRGGFGVLESFAFAWTFQILFWMACGLLLGFAGGFRVNHLLELGVVGAALAAYAAWIIGPSSNPGWREAGLRWWDGAGWMGRLAGLAGGGMALWLLSLAVRMPPVSYDVLSYHLGTAVHIFQDGDFRWYPGESIYTNHFARGANVLMAITIAISGSVAFVNIVQWMTLPPMFAMIYTAMRALGVSQGFATLAAVLPLAIPALALQSTLAYVDLFTAAWFAVGLCVILASLGKANAWRIAWVLACGGLAIAAKNNAAPLCLVLFLAMITGWGWRSLVLPFPRRILAVGAGFVIAATVGLPWMIHNWMEYGSPVYPFMLTLSHEGLPPWEYPLSAARRMSELPPYYEMPLWQKLWLSWTTIDFQSWLRLGFLGSRISSVPDGMLHDPSFGYFGYGQLGENGTAFLLLFLPGLFVGILRTGWLLAGRRFVEARPLVLMAGLPTLAFFLTVSPWWTRLSIFFPVFCVLATVYTIHHLTGTRHSVAARVALGIGLAAALFDASTVVFLNRDPERLRRYEAVNGRVDYTPIRFFQLMDPHKPLYRAIGHVMSEARPGETVSFWTPREPVFTGWFVDERAQVRQFLFPSVWPDPFRYTNEELWAFIREERIVLLMTNDTVPQEFRELIVQRGARINFQTPGYQVYEFPANR